MPAPARAKLPPSETLSLEERIRRRAYELYLQRGNQSGSELDDWLQAEEEILQAERDARVEEASEESFPASNAPAH
jgi:hypothetical protein